MANLSQDFNNLSLNGGQSNNTNDSNHSSYVPPHLRNRRGGAGAEGAANDGGASYGGGYGGGYNNGGYQRGGYGGGYSNGGGYGRRGGYQSNGYGGGYGRRGGFQNGRNGGGYGRKVAGQGKWVDGAHVPAPRDEALELDLFGQADDPTKQSSGINFDNYDDIPVDATGEDVPEPISTFSAPTLDEVLLENVKLSRFTKPTPVQKYSVPIVAAGRDLMACAQTGSGKTGGFLFPVLSQSFKAGPAPIPETAASAAGVYTKRKAYPTALVLAPTRELVSQIYDELKKFAYRSWVKTCVAYGGSDIRQQISTLQRGCDLLVATPGRLNDLIERGEISLANIKYLVLDEADRMLDMGFEPQIRHIVQGCDMPGVQDRQTLLFSATFPKDIQMLARDFLKNYIFLSVGRVGSTSENITQKVLYVEDEDKKSVLLDLLSSSGENLGLTLIFVETKRMADILSDFLINQGYPALSIHGDRTQSERERALDLFRSGRARLMVATAVALRGLDIPNVTHVINYDLPGDVDDYVHRIGRTGRAGNVGIASSFFNRNNRNIARQLKEILVEAKQELPDFLDVIIDESSGPKRGGMRGGRGGRGMSRGGSSGSRMSQNRDFRSSGGSSGYGGASNWGASNWGSSPLPQQYTRSYGYGNSSSSQSDWW